MTGHAKFRNLLNLMHFENAPLGRLHTVLSLHFSRLCGFCLDAATSSTRISVLMEGALTSYVFQTGSANRGLTNTNVHYQQCMEWTTANTPVLEAPDVFYETGSIDVFIN